MLDDIYQIPYEEVAAVEWDGNNIYYDVNLFNLNNGHSQFIAFNPWTPHTDVRCFIDDVPYSEKCVVYVYQGEWIAKLFTDRWNPVKGYETVEIVKPKPIWMKNPEIDKLMRFVDDPFAVHELDKWERDYKLVWYMDPKFVPSADKVWAMSVQIEGKEILGTKDMGYLTPDVSIDFNEHLPDLGINVDDCCPPFWDLSNECAYELDPIHQTPDLTERMWVVKFRPNWRKPKEWKWYGTITPQYHIIYNPDLPKLDYDLDYIVPWHDFKFEHVWMLDRKHLQHGEDDIWAFTLHVTTEQTGSKIVDYISPVVNISYNDDLPKMNHTLDYVIPWHDLAFKHVWYLDDPMYANIWAIEMAATETDEMKEMGLVTPLLQSQLDVIFISYQELNAEKNWKRVLEKAPNALRVDGVKGIFEAHKAAAKLAKTDMFFVVDGDAYLTYDWEFDFQPSIFDRDCTYVWKSRNPINNLTYGYGGVKLFTTAKLKSLKSLGTDLTLSVSKKLMIMDRISNITQFNTSEYNTWKAAFRECAKLTKKNDVESNERLAVWLDPIETVNFAEWAKLGAEQGVAFANANDDITKVNDYNWLENTFNKYIKATDN
jgi:hypothetical protein